MTRVHVRICKLSLFFFFFFFSCVVECFNFNTFLVSVKSVIAVEIPNWFNCVIMVKCAKFKSAVGTI